MTIDRTQVWLSYQISKRRLAPAGLAFTAFCLLIAGFCIGMMVALGMTMAIKMGILQDIKVFLGRKDGKRDSD